MAGKWRSIARSLRIPPTVTSLITTRCSNDPEECLFTILQEWLKKVHDVERYGHPSWFTLVKAIASPSGGANRALAEAIAQKYSGECKQSLIHYAAIITITLGAQST